MFVYLVIIPRNYRIYFLRRCSVDEAAKVVLCRLLLIVHQVKFMNVKICAGKLYFMLFNLLWCMLIAQSIPLLISCSCTLNNNNNNVEVPLIITCTTLDISAAILLR